MHVSTQDYTVYDSSLQDLSLVTLCRRLGRQSGHSGPGIVTAQRVGKVSSDFSKLIFAG